MSYIPPTGFQVVSSQQDTPAAMGYARDRSVALFAVKPVYLKGHCSGGKMGDEGGSGWVQGASVNCVLVFKLEGCVRALRDESQGVTPRTM